MPRKARLKSKSGIYHVMLRGANRQEIFHDDNDNMKFLEFLHKYKVNSKMKVYAWCLMNNHVHLLLREGNEDLSVTMKRIGVSYAHFYNWKYRTIGHLFQDRFKSEIVETKRYLLTVVRYIHQNPVKAGIVQQVNKWKWSSCPGYYGEDGSHEGLLDCDFILRMFSADIAIGRKIFQEFNEIINDDDCLGAWTNNKRKLTDEEARIKIKENLGIIEIPQVKSLPMKERNELLQRVKRIDGLSQRQASRILGVSLSLINRA